MTRLQPRTTWKPAAERTGPPDEAWQADATGGRRRWRGWGWARLLTVLVVFASFLALLIYVTFWLSPARGTCVVVVSTGYEDNLALPHNVYGQKGALALANYVGDHGRAVGLRLQHKTTELANVNDWDRDLLRFPEKNLVVYLALHGGADDHGAFFFPQKAGMPAAPGSLEPDRSRLRLEAVLERLAQVPSNRNVLLIVDATQVAAAWHVGMVHNGFARALDGLDERVRQIPNLVILSASGPEQRSWASEELRRSVFGHYVARGLEGDADVNHDGRVDALELHNYVAKNVTRWAAINRGALQTPMLYPRGPEGEARAQKMRLALTFGKHRSGAGSGTIFESSKELGTAWTQCHDLEKQIPHPEVATPAQWRRYRDLLLRYEQLVVAGADAGASRLAGEMNNLAQQIGQQRTVPLPFSLQNSLALPLAAGHTLPSAASLASDLAALWQAKERKDQEAIWVRLKKEHGGDGDTLREALLRVRLLEMLVERAAQEPTAPLDRAAQLIKLIDAPQEPRPAEAHYLIMLRHSIKLLEAPAAGPTPAKVDKVAETLPLTPDDIKLALRVRLHAERAALGLAAGKTAESGYPYSEHLLPWLQATVAKADEQRRFGEDLLLASDAGNLQQARDYLHKAEQRYAGLFSGKAGEPGPAVTVREALALRDRALATLPYLAAWVAGRNPSATESAQQEQKILQQRLLAACADSHELVRLLEQGPVILAKGEPSLIAAHRTKLDQTRQKLQQGLTAIEAKYDQQLKNVEVRGDVARWQEVNSLLAVPVAQPAVRRELLHKRGLIAESLQKQYLDPSHTASTPGEGDGARAARQATAQNAAIALALLGERTFDGSNDGKHEFWEQVQSQLKSFLLQERWDESDRLAAKIGREIGWRWQHMPALIAKLARKDRPEPLAKALPALEQADRLSRLVDGAGASFLGGAAAPDYRGLLMQQLLLWQAQRTYLDHWFGEQPDDVYFRRAGEAYLKDAGTWYPNPAAAALAEELKQAGALQLQLASAPGVPADGPVRSPTLHLTTEGEFPLQYRLSPASKSARPPSGYPVIWMRAGPLLQPDASFKTQRQSIFVSPAATTLVGTSFVNPLLGKAKPGDKVQETFFTARGLFRGQLIEQTTPIELHPWPQMARVVHPVPRMASVAVRSSKVVQESYGSSVGHITIVLDCSGSMGPPRGQNGLANSKFAEATQTLAQVMRGIPRGTTVSLWIFGEAMGAEKTVAEPEKTIRRVLPPVIWNPDDPGQLQALAQDIAALEPWNESPIVRTMLRARADLDNAVGFKSMIVITDGMDNRIHNDAEFNPQKKDIPTLLVENFKDVQLYIIGFKIASAEQARAQAQFASVGKLGLGKFYEIRDRLALELTLKNVLRQKLRYWVDRLDDAPVVGVPEKGLDVSQTGYDEKWFPGGLNPGNYKVRVHTNRTVSKQFALNPSDLLLLELAPLQRLGGPAEWLDFRRVLYAEEGHPKASLKLKNQWLMGLLQNERKGDGAQMLVTLERKGDADEEVLQQLKPRDLWLEVSAPGGSGEVLQRFCYQPGFPAPAWNIDLPAWPRQAMPGGAGGAAPARPVVNAWFSPYQPARGLLLERDHAFASPLDVRNKRIKMGDREVIIDSIILEDRVVETQAPRPDQPVGKRQIQTCLVVRLSCPSDSPVWVRLHGLPHGGEEHLFFTRANKYTGVFWPVTPAQANEVLESIELISLADFKKQATQFNYTIALDNLYPPSLDSKRPQSPVDLFALSEDDVSVAGETVIPPGPTAEPPPPPAKPELPTPPGPGVLPPPSAVQPPPVLPEKGSLTPELPAPKLLPGVVPGYEIWSPVLPTPTTPLTRPIPQLPYQEQLFPAPGLPMAPAALPPGGR